MKCWECEEEAEAIHRHHVVPKSRGGTKTVPLCEECHSKAHHRNKNMNTSELTREGLRRAKARGVRLGSPKIAEARVLANERRSALADEFATKTMAIIHDIKATGVSKLSHLADCLNRRGYTTRRGNQFTATAVRRVIVRPK